MDKGQLEAAIAIENGQLVIERGSLTPSIDSMLADFYGGQRLVIANATPADGDGDGDVIRISGTAGFLNVADLPVSAAFSVDASGEVQATVSYSLPGGTDPATAWRFSRSFPKLPPVTDYAPESSGPPSLLDSLAFPGARFVVASAPVDDLARGIHFVSQLNAPADSLGLLLSSLGTAWPVPLHGSIRIPRATDLSAKIPSELYPWEQAEVPGLLLKAPLGTGASFGSLRLTDPCLYVYSPHDSDWLTDHPFLPPIMACTATLSIPSAAISAQLVGLPQRGLEQFVLTAKLSGVSVGRLADLADLAGADDLLASLPSALQSAIGALSSLALTRIEMTIGSNLKSVGFKLGMPDLVWPIWGDQLAATEVECMFSISSPFSAERRLSLTVYGTLLIDGSPLRVFATNDDGFCIYAELAGGANVHLGQLLSRFCPDIGAPADLTVDSILICAEPGAQLALSASLLGQPHPWQIDLGPSGLTIRDVLLGVVLPASGPSSATFGGTIDFGDGVSLTTLQSLPGPARVQASCASLNLSTALARLTSPVDWLPAGFDLELHNPAIVLDLTAGSQSFRVNTLVDGVGELGLMALRADSRWGFVLGINLSEGLSSVPGLSALSALEGILGLSRTTLVAASVTPTGFTLPGVVLPPTGLVAGLNAYGSLTLGESSGLAVLQNLLGLSASTVLQYALQIGADPAQSSLLSAAINGNIGSNVQLTGTLGVRLVNLRPSLFVNGTVTLPIQNQSCVFSTNMQISLAPPSAFLSGTMQGTIDFSGITLTNVALQIGVDSAGIPSLGVAAMVALGRFNGSVAVFLDSTNPSQSLLAGSISDLSLKDVADTMGDIVGFTVPPEIGEMIAQVGLSGTQKFSLPASSAALLDDNDAAQVSQIFKSAGITLPADPKQLLIVRSSPPGKWFVTDLSQMRHYTLSQDGTGGITGSLDTQLYVAPQTTRIGSLSYSQGFFVNGAVSLFGLSLTATIQIVASKGISVNTRMSPVTVVSPNFFSLSGVDDRGPRFSMSTYPQPARPDENLRQPHLLINGSLKLLGFAQNVYISVGTGGLAFNLSLSTPAVSWTVAGSFRSLTDLSAGGAITVGLQKIPPLDFGALGKVSLNTNLGGSLYMKVDRTGASATLSGSITLFGQTFSSGDVKLRVGTDNLNALPQLAADALYGVIKSYLDVADRWAAWVKSGFIQGITSATQFGQVLASQFKLTGAQIGQLAKDVMGYALADVAAALQAAGQVGEAATRILKDLDYGVSEVAGVLKSVYGEADAAAATYLRAVGYAVGDIAGALKTIYGDTDAAVMTALHTAGATAQEVANYLSSLGNTRDAAAKAMKEAGYAVTEVGGVIKAVWIGTTDVETAKALKAAGYAVTEVGTALKECWNLTAEAAAKTLKAAVYQAEKVAQALQSAYGSTEAQVAAALKGAEYAVNQVGLALKNAYGATQSTVYAALKSAGYQAAGVASALQYAWALTDAALATVLKDLGNAAAEVAGVLSKLGSSRETATQSLKTAGYVLSDVVGALKATWISTTDAEAAKALKAAEYTTGEVAGVLKDSWSDADAAAAKAMKTAGYVAADTARGLQSAYGDAENAAAAALTYAEYTLNEIGGVLKTVYGAAENTMAMALAASGYVCTQVASVLKTYGATDASTAAALKAADYVISDIASALLSVWSVTAAAATAFFEDLGYPALDVAKTLQTVWNLNEATAAQLLKKVEYAAADVAAALKSLWSLTDLQIAQRLKGVGYAAADVATALKSLWSYSDAQAAQLLRDIKYTAHEVGTALKSVWSFTDAQGAQLLKGVGYTVSEVAGALGSAWSVTDVQAARLLKGLDYPVTEVATAFRSAWVYTDAQTAAALKGAEYVASEIARGIRTAYNATAAAVASVLRGLQYDATAVAEALKPLWNSETAIAEALYKAGCDVSAAAGALLKVFGATAISATNALRSAGYAVAGVAGVLNSMWGLTATAVGETLGLARYVAAETAAAIKQVFGETEAGIAAALKAGRYLANDAANALKTVCSAIDSAAATALRAAGYGVQEVAQALKDVWSDTDVAMTTALRIAGVTGAEMGNCLKQMYGLAGDAGLQLLKSAGYATSEIASALRLTWGYTNVATTAALQAASYTAAQVAAGIKAAWTTTTDAIAAGLLQGVGYTATEVADALKTVFNTNATATAYILRIKDYLVNDVAAALKTVYVAADKAAASALRSAGYVSRDTANALKSVYGVGSEAAAAALKSAGYNATQIANALKDVFSFNDVLTAELFKKMNYALNAVGSALKTAFTNTDVATAQAMQKAKYYVNDIGTALKTAYSATDSGVAKALKGAGYEADEVAGVLKSVYGDSDTAAAKALKSAGYSAKAIGGALKSVYGSSRSTLLNLLQDIGFSLADVLSALEALF